jgi:hypothetical protein
MVMTRETDRPNSFVAAVTARSLRTVCDANLQRNDARPALDVAAHDFRLYRRFGNRLRLGVGL